MLELNRAERRALWLGATLFSLGAAARLGLAPNGGSRAWSAAPPSAAAPGEAGAGSAAGPAGVRERVRAGIARAERAARPLAAGERVDPNGAPAVELERLPGVGPSRARAIVEARAAGPFRGPEDLERVPGIGPATARRLAPYLAFPAEEAGGASTPRAPAAEAGGAGVREPLDVNRATAADLERLPGIGPALAGRIVEWRDRRGRFRSVDDLLAVPGIGPRTLERIRPLVAVR